MIRNALGEALDATMEARRKIANLEGRLFGWQQHKTTMALHDVRRAYQTLEALRSIHDLKQERTA